MARAGHGSEIYAIVSTYSDEFKNMITLTELRAKLSPIFK